MAIDLLVVKQSLSSDLDHHVKKTIEIVAQLALTEYQSRYGRWHVSCLTRTATRAQMPRKSMNPKSKQLAISR